MRDFVDASLNQLMFRLPDQDSRRHRTEGGLVRQIGALLEGQSAEADSLAGLPVSPGFLEQIHEAFVPKQGFSTHIKKAVWASTGSRETPVRMSL
jgi:hypothetical protein